MSAMITTQNIYLSETT